MCFRVQPVSHDFVEAGSNIRIAIFSASRGTLAWEHGVPLVIC
jgi:hypothetical protein